MHDSRKSVFWVLILAMALPLTASAQRGQQRGRDDQDDRRRAQPRYPDQGRGRDNDRDRRGNDRDRRDNDRDRRDGHPGPGPGRGNDRNHDGRPDYDRGGRRSQPDYRAGARGRGRVVIIPGGGRRYYRPDPGFRIRPYASRVPYDRSLELLFFGLLRDSRATELGSTRLSHWNPASPPDFDFIPVNLPFRDECVTAVRIHVKYFDANIDHIAVSFDDSPYPETIEVNRGFEAGSYSAWLDVPGFSRCVRSISVVGETLGGSYLSQSEIEIYGLRP